MHHVIPSAQNLRTLYALTSDRIWVALVIVTCLMLAGEVADYLWTQTTPAPDHFFSF